MNSWFHYDEPEAKQMSMVWKLLDSPPPKNAETAMCEDKVKSKYSWTAMESFRSRKTLNADYYSEVNYVVLF